jgi:hypothetical protein
VDINWEYPPKAFTIETSQNGDKWKGINSVSSNTQWRFQQSLKNAYVKKFRIVMTETHPGKMGSINDHGVYGINSIKLMSRPIAPIVQKCDDAAKSVDARDKWFLSEVTQFYPAKNPLLTQAPEEVNTASAPAGTGAGEEKGGPVEHDSASGFPAKKILPMLAA